MFVQLGIGVDHANAIIIFEENMFLVLRVIILLAGFQFQRESMCDNV